MRGVEDYYHDNVGRDQMEAGFMPGDLYEQTHASTVICCHDAIVWQEGRGLLLIKRKMEPVKNHWWVAGGRLQRGVPVEESLRNRVREESGMILEELTFLYLGRTCFPTDPFGHGRGSDTLNLTYVARSSNKEVCIDETHTDYMWVNVDNMDEKRAHLCPYILHIVEMALEHAKQRQWA